MPKTWYIETETEQRFGPYADYTDAVADAERMDARIIAQDDDSGEVITWECPGCGADAVSNTDILAITGAPYCFKCDCEMDQTGSDVPASAECPNCHKTIHGCDGDEMLCLCGCRMVGVKVCACKDGFTCITCAEVLTTFRLHGERKRLVDSNDADTVAVLRRVRAAIRCNYDSAIIAREYGAEIDAALGGPDDRGPLENHPAGG